MRQLKNTEIQCVIKMNTRVQYVHDCHVFSHFGSAVNQCKSNESHEPLTVHLLLIFIFYWVLHKLCKWAIWKIYCDNKQAA